MLEELSRPRIRVNGLSGGKQVLKEATSKRTEVNHATMAICGEGGGKRLSGGNKRHKEGEEDPCSSLREGCGL